MISQAESNAIRIAADVGGTFTDVVAIDGEGSVWRQKLPSTPPDFEASVLRGATLALEQSAAAGAAVRQVVHGTTVATNAILERRGARTALVTTKGFRDVLALRRIRAPLLYDLFFEKPKELVERRLRLEIDERVSASGEVLAPLEATELWKLKERLDGEHIESVAVCLLHSYAFPEHENRIGEFLRSQLPSVNVSLSSDVVRVRGEYERTATTVANAYLRPVMEQYLKKLSEGLRSLGIAAPLLIMQSAGGLAHADDAASKPVLILESGPAAGVLAARHFADRIGLANVISLDIGGTTAKAALIERGTVNYSPQYEVGASLSAGSRLQGGGGDVILAPSIDLVEVGAGGGSVAYLDAAKGLRIGPRSAGAVPGPACYRRGGREPTVTDANVVLGYIRAGELAGGDVCIDREAAQRAVFDHIAKPLGMDLMSAAEGIHRIANARTLRALRAVSTERGRDAREFALMAFGGSGPVHAAGLGLELHCPKIVVPPMPGLFSALGLLMSGVEHHDVRSCYLHGEGLSARNLQPICRELEQSLMGRFDYSLADRVAIRFFVDVQYRGQSSLISVPIGGDTAPGNGCAVSDRTIRQLSSAFEVEHERLYGHRSDPLNPIQAAAVRAIGRYETADYAAVGRSSGGSWAAESSRPAYFALYGRQVEAPVVSRDALQGVVNGPLLIDEYDSTTVVPPGVRVQRDAHGNLVLEPADG